MEKYFDLSRKGACSPTLLTAILGVMAIVVLLGQLISNKDKKKNELLVKHIIYHLLMTIVMVGLMYYLCENDKSVVSWWLFGIFYVFPFVVVFMYLMYVFYNSKQIIIFPDNVSPHPVF